MSLFPVKNSRVEWPGVDFIVKDFMIKDFIFKDSRAEWSGMDFIGQLHIGPTAPAMERSGEQ